MILIIAITNKESFIGVAKEGKYLAVTPISKENQRDNIFLKVSELIGPQDITGVIVYIGPGPFTGVRVAVSIANAIAFALSVPVAGVAKIDQKEEILKVGLQILKEGGEKLVFPVYDREPNITKPKNC
jgi:tRNA A37 threonylcarbamoyladenosine modification protein TsaB